MKVRLFLLTILLALPFAEARADTDPPVAHAGTPGWNELLRGSVTLRGWATDASGVVLVQFLVDGSTVGIQDLWYGRSVPGACDLHSYLNDPNCPYVGWLGTLVTTQLTDGPHTLTVTAWDGMMNYWKFDRPIRVDNTLPYLNVTNPSQGAVVRDNQTIFVSSSDWGATGSGVARVEVRVNGTLLSTDTSAPYSYLWDTRNQGNEGTNTINVKSYDVAGNVTSVTRTVTVDNTPPSATLTAPSNGAIVRSTVPLTASAWDNVGISSVRFWVDGQHLSGDATSPYTASWDTTSVTEGTHSIYARAHDLTSLSGQSQTVQVIVDNTRPTAGISGPANGSLVSGTVSWSVKAGDTNGIERVNFYVDGVNRRSDSTYPYTFDWDTSTVADGSHTVQARALDRAGWVKWSEARTVTVDRTAPVLDFREPKAGDFVNTTETIVVHAQDLESPGNEIDRLEYWVNGQLLASQQSQGIYIFNYHWDTVADGVEGSNTVVVKAFDQAGNVASDSHQVIVDNQAPTATLTAPTSGATVRGTLTLEASGSDASGLQSMRFWVDGTHLSGDGTAPYTASWDTTTVAEGLHSLYAVAWDEPGNPGQSQTVQVTVDNTPPTATLTAPAHGATVGGNVLLTASASDAQGIANVRFFVDGARVTIDSNAPYAYTWDSTTAADGPHDIVARAFDRAGNATYTANHRVTVDNVDMTLTFVAEAGLALDSRGLEPGGTNTIPVRLTRNDGSAEAVALSVSGLPGLVTASHPATLAPNLTATISFTADPMAADGSYPFQVVATESGESAVLGGTLIVADLPNVTAVSPQTIPAGQTSTVTITGTDLAGAGVWVATEKPHPETPDRLFPLVSVLSIDPSGTALQVAVDATAPGVEGYYNLVVENAAGGAPAPIRVLPDHPVVELYTPSQPSDSDLYVFAAVGANLANATLTAADPNIEFLEVESADDYVIGFMHLLPGAAATTEITVTGAAGSVSLPVEVMASPVESRTENVVVGRSVTDPGLLVQQFAPFEIGPPSPGDPHYDPWEPIDPIFRFPCGGRFRKTETEFIRVKVSDLVGREGRELLDALKQLPLNQSIDLDFEILDVTLSLETSITFVCEISTRFGLRFTDVEICITGQVRAEVIGLGGTTCRFESCVDGSSESCTGTGPLAELLGFSSESDTSCAVATDLPSSMQGDREVSVEAEACCADTLHFRATGTNAGGESFDREIWSVDTDVDR
ncbi:MAG: Ig-like domain-containing protein, partial [Acidobacteriota bacterium]